MNNGEFCNREVVVAEKDAGVVEISQLMRDYRVGDVVIVERREKRTVPVGIITDRDLVIRMLACEKNPEKLRAENIMSSDLKTVRTDGSLWESIEVMRTHRVRRVPVVDEHGRLEGILTADDLIDVISEEISSLAKTLMKGGADSG